MSQDDYRVRVRFDTGGTFTDLVLVGRGQRRVLELPSTPNDPSAAVITGLGQLFDESDGVGSVGGVVREWEALDQGARVAWLLNPERAVTTAPPTGGGAETSDWAGILGLAEGP